MPLKKLAKKLVASEIKHSTKKACCILLHQKSLLPKKLVAPEIKHST
jgi:hypothetical protein